MSMSADDSIPPRELAGKLRPLPQLIFSSRWLQLSLYLGLIIARRKSRRAVCRSYRRFVSGKGGAPRRRSSAVFRHQPLRVVAQTAWDAR
jgi:hypothetical protein